MQGVVGVRGLRLHLSDGGFRIGVACVFRERQSREGEFHHFPLLFTLVHSRLWATGGAHSKSLIGFFFLRAFGTASGCVGGVC